MADLTPRTRSENFLNGEDLEPITRREHFYAGRENELPEGHQEPETREEWFIQKYREAGDVTVESLSVTENGTYTAPSGKAYSPVSVNVPLPSNAYLLKSIENVNIATFADGTDNFVKALEVAIEPQQDLHGYDSPWVGGAGKNKSAQKITEFSFSNNAGGSSSVQGDTLVITTTSSSNSGVYSILGFVESFTGKCSYSVDVKANTNGDVLIGMTNAGRKTVSLTTNWQRVKFEDVTFDGNSKTFVVYSQGTANTIQVKDFMFELGSVAHDYEPYSNICPISGWSAVDVNVSGKNLFPMTVDGIKTNSLNMNVSWNGNVGTAYGASITLHTDDGISVSKISISGTPKNTIYLCIGSFNLKSNTSYVLSGCPSNRPENGILYVSNQPSGFGSWVDNGSGATYNATQDWGDILFYIRIWKDVAQNNDWYPMIRFATETDSTYEPYNGNTYTIDLDGTRYSGKLDVVNGVLTLTHGFISSYNGETLPSTWISDRDVYAEGTTPTIGAEVCYKLATPQTIQLTPTIIKSLQGDNNFFADSGEIELLKYWAKEVM